MFRKALFLPVMALAVGGPYLAINGDLRKTVTQAFSSSEKTGEESPKTTSDLLAIPFSGDSSIAPLASGLNTPGPPLDGPRVAKPGDVIRFDMTPQMITRHWGRVSTSLADLHLEGMRVTLVTGPQTHDLAGSLTYYYNNKQQLRRISFHGTTGDPRPLIELCENVYHMKEQPNLGAGLYMMKWNKQPVSALRIRHASVINGNAAHTRYDISLEVNWPGSKAGMSPEFTAMLDRGQQAKRW
jgi:hypothetical protein